jgi:hypothetical protein
MRKILLLIIIIVFASCNKSKCRPYSDAINDGSIPRKTTTITLSDSTTYELDYVRDHEGYRDKPFFCYGHLELDNNAFAKAAAPFLKIIHWKKYLELTFCVREEIYVPEKQ